MPARPGRESPPLPERTASAVEAYERAVSILRAEAEPPLDAPSGLREEREDNSPFGEGRRLSRSFGRGVGIVLHELLESWDGVDDLVESGQMERAARQAALETGVEHEPLAQRSREILSEFLRTELAAEFRQLDKLGREVPLLLRGAGGRVYRGSIDLLYRDAEGRIVVADYKTDDESDEALLAERYRPQLEVYARAVQQSLRLDEPPRAELWLLRRGRRIPV